MKNTRILEWEEYRKPTVKIFTGYEVRQWESTDVEYEVHIISQPIKEYVKKQMDIWNKLGETRRIWIGVNSVQDWQEILYYRNQIRSKLYFSFYMNSIIGIEKDISHAIRCTIEDDYFVFNSPFAKNTFDKVVGREKEIRYAINSVSVTDINSDRFHSAKETRKKNQICVFSRLNPYKNTHHIIEALMECGWDGKVVLGILPNKNNIGKYYEEHLRKLINKTDINIIGMREYKRDEINEIMSESIGCIIVSSSFEETQGKVIIEAANNCCLPVVNKWNGHQDYIPNDYIGLIDTNWDPMNGISIDKKKLVERIRNLNNIYSTDKSKYEEACKTILYNLKRICSTELKKMSARKGTSLQYLDYIEHFAGIDISDKWRNFQVASGFNVDYYIWLREHYKQKDFSKTLESDYQCLKQHQNNYELAPLLDLITRDCLYMQNWNKDILKKIVELIEAREIYENWCNQIRVIFSV